METSVSGFTFFSNFDSGNLAKVVLDEPDEDSTEDGTGESASERQPRPVSAERQRPMSGDRPRKSSGRRQKRAAEAPPLSATDYAFKIWTRPDCGGTEFENGNRTWFFFGFRGSPHIFLHGNGVGGKVVKFSVMNLNKQSKLFSQGMTPIILVVPQQGQLPSYHSLPNGGWERIRERPTYYTASSSDEGTSNFIMSFRVLCEPNTTTYLAFTYPYSYRDLQIFLSRLEKKHGSLSEKSFDTLTKSPANSIYFHRENVCYSLEKRRIDLLTISGVNAVLSDREEKLDKLFPEHSTVNDKGRQVLRPFKFAPSKKIIFVSARVHPGETQSSFVMNGFLRFLLRENDPRSVALRKKYVFKLIPMLNPDGVVNGHYRTDCRGVNLNRVYGRPVFELHPQIFAARKLLLYAHHRKEIFENFPPEEPERSKSKKSNETPNFFLSPNDSKLTKKSEAENQNSESNLSFRTFTTSTSSNKQEDNILGSSPSSDSLYSGITSSTPSHIGSTSTPKFFSTSTTIGQLGYEMTETSRFSEGDESIADFSERHTFGIAPSPQRSIFSTPVGPTTFAAAFAQAASGPGLSTPVRRRHLSFGKEDYSKKLPSHDGDAAKLSDFEDNNLDLEDGNQNVVGLEVECPNVVAQEENANLDFVDKFVRPNSTSFRQSSTSFTIPINDMFFKHKSCQLDKDEDEADPATNDPSTVNPEVPVWDPKTSGLFLYVDIHGHASKRGIFMYGNYFHEVETQATSMLLPKLMSINCANFDFPACNFTERNMYLKDRHTGAGREGSGRVSVFKSSGLIHSYTLECNFNTGRVVNGVPMASRDAGRATPPPPPHPLPSLNPGTGSTPNAILQDQVSPKYTPEIYEDAGKALATSVLDLTESNPWTRLTCSAFKNLRGVREWLRKYIRAAKAAESEQNAERESRGRFGRRRSTNSESSVKSGNHSKISPMKADIASPTRSLRSSIRRMRTFSSSTNVGVGILSTPKKSLNSSATSYQPSSKMARKNSATLQQQQLVTTIAKSVESGSAPPSSPIGGATRFPSLAKSNSFQSQSSSGLKTNLSSKKILGISKRKSKRNRSTSLGKSKLESQSCPSSRPGSSVAPSSRPGSSVAPGSRPNSPFIATSPSSPRSPSISRRSLSIGSIKCTRSRPGSPNPSSPTPAPTTSLNRASSLKSIVTPKKLKKKLNRKSFSKLVLTSPTNPDLGSDDPEASGRSKDTGSPKMTPKKKIKINQGKKMKSKPLKRTKIIMSAASGLNPVNL